MLHQYKLNGYNVVLDTCSGSVHSVDDVAYDIIALYPDHTEEEIISALMEKYGDRDDVDEDEIRECIGDVRYLEEHQKLYTPDTYEPLAGEFKKRSGDVIKALCLHVSHTCNLNCEYCFASQGKYHGDRALMTFEVAKQAMDFLVAHSGTRRNLEVDFFGGEPLMNWDVVKQTVDYCRSIEKEAGKNFRFTVTTNGMLIDDEVIDYCNKEMSNVVLSLDGRKEVHDRTRVDYAGNGSWERIVPKFKKLVDARGGKNYYMRGTFTHLNTDFTNDIFTMADLGFRELSMEPVVAKPGDPLALTEEDLPVLKEEYELLAKEMLRREETGDGFTFYHYMIDLTSGPCIYKRISGCGSGTEYMAVTPWGDLYPCHQFVGEEEYKLGDIWNGVTEKDKQDEFRYCNAYARPDCADCWAKLYCSGGCAANAYHATGDVKGVYEYGCELFRKRIECAIMIQVAHAEHPDLYKPHRIGGDKAVTLGGRLAAVPDDEDCNTCDGSSGGMNMKYDIIIIGAGPGGIFSAYELTRKATGLKIAVFEEGHELSKRHCPIDGKKVKSCIHCPTCAIMNGFGGAGAFSDGKYNITNDFGGTLYEHIGRETALELMEYVDDINCAYGGAGTKMYSTAGTEFKKKCMQNGLTLLDASVRHLGTDINYIVLEHLYDELKDKVDFYFNTPVTSVEKEGEGYRIHTAEAMYDAETCIISVGRSGSHWMETVCSELDIPTMSNRVDIGVRVEVPAPIFEHITDELYEGKIVYRTEKFEDNVRTFCMNPHGIVVNENTNGIVTVNGHSFEDEGKKTDNTNFALLVSKHFSEPFKDSNGYGESIARLSNMLGGGVIVQRFGDLERGRRSTVDRMKESRTVPTLKATPGDLSLVLPKRILDGIIEMIYALDKIAPGMANDDTLLYGVEVKFYNMEVELDENLETCHKNLYVIGDGSGVTHSLSHASASGVYVARHILEQNA